MTVDNHGLHEDKLSTETAERHYVISAATSLIDDVPHCSMPAVDIALRIIDFWPSTFREEDNQDVFEFCPREGVVVALTKEGKHNIHLKAEITRPEGGYPNTVQFKADDISMATSQDFQNRTVQTISIKSRDGLDVLNIRTNGELSYSGFGRGRRKTRVISLSI